VQDTHRRQLFRLEEAVEGNSQNYFREEVIHHYNLPKSLETRE